MLSKHATVFTGLGKLNDIKIKLNIHQVMLMTQLNVYDTQSQRLKILVYRIKPGAKYFSKLDLAQAYHQLELHEDSRYITTFSTHVGLFRYKRLNYGTNAAAEVFQYTLQQQLQGTIPGVNYRYNTWGQKHS